MKTLLKQIMSKHWAGMLVGEQIDAWADEDLWGENYQMDTAHVEESVRYYLSDVEESEELKDLYCLFIDHVDWQALKEEVMKLAIVKWNNQKETTQ